MKPPLYPSSCFFLLVVILISINTPTTLCEDDSHYTNCSSNSFSCGNLSNLTYPFWGENRAEYCGQPNFQLKCEDGVPKLIVDSIIYRIIDLYFTAQSLTVARDDYWYKICPSVYQNNTFDPTVFQYFGNLLNVTLFYDCTSTSFNPMAQVQFLNQNCKRDDGTTVDVYYAGTTLYVDNCNSVTIPIFQSQGPTVVYNITGALDAGFGLQWTINNDECNKCNSSGGECGYDTSKRQFSCFCKDGPHTTSCSDGSSGKSFKLDGWVITTIGVSAGGAGIVAISIVIIYNRERCLRLAQRRIFKKTGKSIDHNVEVFMQNYGSTVPRRYSYSEVKRITNSFRNKLGKGGYGVVYKAILPDGRLVAVKVINETHGSGEEFINEVASISRTSHVNIITLLGFCYERNKPALIYEFMPNGSLDMFICEKGTTNAICSLEWKILYQIATGIARGLEYLHRGCNTRILHFDIKPQNILLDEDFCPKISDFGLAKICQKKESIVSMLGTRGTAGYIAPEVFSRTFGGVSHKSDVYSYGMLVLEMVGGRKNYDTGGSTTSEMYFPDWIYKDIEQGNFPASCVSITEQESDMVMKMTLVSLWCIQTNPSDRPSMSKVVEMLEGPLQTLAFPPKPYLYNPAKSPLQFSSRSSTNMSEGNSNSTQI